MALVTAASFTLLGWPYIAAGADTQRPTVTITAPTSSSTFTTNASPLTIGGSASDNVGVTQVTWSNNRGGSGTATGTPSWSASGIALQSGTNTLTVTARDAAGNTGKDTLTVTYDPTPPTVTITSPTSASTFATNTSSLALGGTAADNVGVTQVTWSNSQGSSGTASGTTNWSVSSIVLQPGTNVLTVTARDAAGNAGTDTLTVTYTDITGPAVAITSPTNNQAVAISPITVTGTASDAGRGNSGISSVTVNGTAASGGTAVGSGTANWSRPLTLSPGSNTITVVAKDNSPAQNATTVQITVVYDPTAPTVAITSPTTAATFTATTSPITLGGTAADNIGVTQVTWSNSAGGSGTATGTTSWSASGIALVAGSNVLTVTARDGAGNTATATLTVTYTPSGASSLVAAYTFDEGTGTTSADVSGNGYTATLVNGPAWVAGEFGSALSFDGVSSYATTNLTTNLPNWTVSGWVRSPAAPNSGPPSGPIHRETNYLFNWNHPDPTFRGAAALSVGGVWYGASFGALAANTWYYLAATYDGATLKAYSNGVLVTSNTALSGPPDSEALPLTIGRHALLTNNFFQGIVDNVRIYNRALSQAEIQYDMNTPVGGAPAPDTTPPTVAISSPTTSTAFATNTSSLTLAGTASDNVGVTQVTWSNSLGGSGTATGTTSWSVNGVALQPGSNVLTVTARDAAGNMATAALTVTYDPTPPTVAITSPTTASTYTTNVNSLALGGTAADNVGVTRVTWSNSQGGNGTAAGTANWSVSGILLQSGTNVLTVTARDAAGNTATATLTVTCTAVDNTGPAVTITSHTNNQVVNGTSITVEGTASDSGRGNNGISSVTLNGTAATGGTAVGSGTANWSRSLTLSPGSNTITVVAKDNSSAQNATTVQITVVDDPSSPTVAITSPTTAATFTATANPMTLGGTAADNIGVTEVAWSNSQGGSGTATGTTSWSASGIVLQPGTNVLTVTARDAAGNTAIAILTVTYMPPSGLVAAYGFDEGAGTISVDVTGNGHTANLVNGPSWVAGKFGSALSFDGVSSYATTSLTTNLPNWTVSGWVRSPAAPNSGPPSGPIHRETNYLFNWNHPDPTFRGAAALSIGGAWYGASFGALAANTWYYLAATYDGETLKAFSNGVLVTSNTAPSGPADSEALPLTIGRHALLTNNFFQGIVDNVRIYNRALSQTEIQSDMNTPIASPPPDQTPPTVRIISPTSGATVSGTITVTATASDNVVVGVRFTLDGAPLGIEETSPPYSTSWDTSTATNASHVLSAVAQDAAGNQTASVINVNVSNGSASGPSVIGQWSAPFSLPIKDVHMVLFQTGDVLLWDAFASGQMAYLWNWSTGVLTYVPSTDNIFCAGPVLMTDGSALIAGGHSGTAFVGIPDVNRFDPVTRTWGALAPMAFPRWYPTATTLSDGRVLVVSGSTTCSTCLGDIPELYNPTTNTWTQLSDARLSMPLYPHMFLLSNGRVLYAGASMGTIQTQSLDVGTQTWTMVDPVAVEGGSSVMYRPDVILKSGSPAYPTQVPTTTASNSAYVLDMTQPTPGWQQVGSMTFGRTYHSLTILPDGNVLATGGSATSDAASQPIYAAEIWNPQTGTWSLMSSMQMARTYHETALLLPDGRVLVGGGGGCCGAPDQYNAEIFSPPYLFKGARPTIASVSTSIGYGSQFFVGTPDAASIASVALIRLGSDTHEFNRDQRYLPLSFTAVVNGLNVTMPANWNLAPPGDYMLFLVNGNGVPSVASMVTVH